MAVWDWGLGIEMVGLGLTLMMTISCGFCGYSSGGGRWGTGMLGLGLDFEFRVGDGNGEVGWGCRVISRCTQWMTAETRERFEDISLILVYSIVLI